MGIIKKQWELSPRDKNVKDWQDNIEDRDWEIRNMEVYAAMIDRMDQGIGKIIRKLEENQELDNTLIFYLQDNGACAEDLGWINNRVEFKENQLPMDPKELQTKMIPDITRDGVPVKMMREALAGPPGELL